MKTAGAEAGQLATRAEWQQNERTGDICNREVRVLDAGERCRSADRLFERSQYVSLRDKEDVLT